MHQAADIDVPQLLAAHRVEREEVPVHGATEHQVAGRGEHPGGRARLDLVLPSKVTGLRVDRPDRALVVLDRQRRLKAPTGEAVALSADPRGGGIVAATLPGTIEASNEKPDIYLAIESDAPCAAVYSGHGAPAGELRRPSLILDFLPE